MPGKISNTKPKFGSRHPLGPKAAWNMNNFFNDLLATRLDRIYWHFCMTMNFLLFFLTEVN